MCVGGLSVCILGVLGVVLSATDPPGHNTMAVMLSERKTSQYLLQRCKIDV